MFRDSLSLFVDPSRTAGVLACVAAILLVYVDTSLKYQYVGTLFTHLSAYVYTSLFICLKSHLFSFSDSSLICTVPAQ